MSAPKNTCLESLQAKIGYLFRDGSLLQQALTHPSFLHDNPDCGGSNQRLEFLGDAVLAFVLTDELFRLFPEDREGSLSKRRAMLTRGPFLCTLAREIDLSPCLRLSPSEEQTGGRQRSSSIEDAFEAVIGAIFLDSDMDTCRRVILRLLGSLPARLTAAQPLENPKGRLQEWAQAQPNAPTLVYAVTHISGQDHEREYEAIVLLNGEKKGTGRGPSKKVSEENAARYALKAVGASL